MKRLTEQPQHIGTLLSEVLSEKGYLTFCKEYAIMQKWGLLVDTNLAAASICERIEDGIMYVKLKSAPWRQEAVYCKDKVLKKIHKDFGCSTIKDIVFY
jgi:hypothetical protein